MGSFSRKDSTVNGPRETHSVATRPGDGLRPPRNKGHGAEMLGMLRSIFFDAIREDVNVV